MASACPGYLTVVLKCWDEPRCSESFGAKIPFGPIPQLLQKLGVFVPRPSVLSPK
jgi:hypothetical protein